MRDSWSVCAPSLYLVNSSMVPDGFERALKDPPSLIRQMEPATVLRRRVFRHSAAASFRLGVPLGIGQAPAAPGRLSELAVREQPAAPDLGHRVLRASGVLQ